MKKTVIRIFFVPHRSHLQLDHRYPVEISLFLRESAALTDPASACWVSV